MNRAEEIFMEIVRAGSLSKAADRLYVSQPSLSKYVQRLEKQVGTALFDRSTNPMRLNDAGQVYYEYLLACAEAHDRLQVRLEQICGLQRGTLYLGMPSFCAQCYLARVLPAYARRYPDVRVALLEDSGERLEQALLEQRIDAAVLHLPVTNRELRFTPLFDERVLLAVAGSRGPGWIQNGDLGKFRELPFILPLPEQKLGKYTAALFAQHGILPEICMKTRNVTTMLTLAARGMGAAFVPEGGLGSIAGDILNRLDFYDLGGPPMTVALVQRRNGVLPAYAQALIDLICGR